MVGLIKPFLWTMIILHHTSQDTDTTAGMRKWAVRNGYDDIPYHFVIDRYGGLHYGRPLTMQGCHGNKEANEHGIGIAMIGNFNEHEPSILQLCGASNLCSLLCITHQINPKNIYGHKEVRDKPTSCPGDKFPLREFKESVIKNTPRIYGAWSFGRPPF